MYGGHIHTLPLAAQLVGGIVKDFQKIIRNLSPYLSIIIYLRVL